MKMAAEGEKSRQRNPEHLQEPQRHCLRLRSVVCLCDGRNKGFLKSKLMIQIADKVIDTILSFKYSLFIYGLGSYVALPRQELLTVVKQLLFP